MYDGGDDIDLIYIIDPDKYRAFSEKGIHKYLLKLFNMKYKGKKIHQIFKEDHVICQVYGINLHSLNYHDEEDLEEYISQIKDVIDDEYTYIYIEESLPISVKKTIADSLSMRLSEGKDIRIYNIPYIIEALKSKWKRDTMKKEILIISNNKDEVIGVIDSISNEFSFISVLGLNDSDGEDVYKKILDDTGISVYFPNRDNISMKRYGLIINTLDDISISLKDIKNNAIIIDFSETKPFTGINRYVIEDVSIDISGLGLIDNPWIGKEVSSDLFQCFGEAQYKSFNRIYKNDDLFTIEDFLSQGQKIKGGY